MSIAMRSDGGNIESQAVPRVTIPASDKRNLCADFVATVREREGQGRNATRGLRSHEKETSHHSVCVPLPISNYLHKRIAFGARRY